MSFTRALFLLILSVILLPACSEDDPSTMTHYFNPVWTPDGSVIVAGYLSSATGTVDVAGPVTGSDLAVMNIATRALRIVPMPLVNTVHALYAFDVTGEALAFVQNGSILFFDMDGKVLLNYTPTEGGNPELMAFTNTGNSFVWIGGAPGNYSINQATYSSLPWKIDNQLTMITLQESARIIAMTLTGQRSLALRFDDGVVKEYDFNGDTLNSYMTTPFDAPNPWQQRMIYVSGNNGRRLYVRDAAGLHLFDLSSGMARQLVYGQVVDLDVSAPRNSMVYETGTGDTWIATTEGLPLTRIAPQNIMPRFSPAANGIALVERLDEYTDSLHVLLLR
jgi:hypothetical protein